MRPYNLHNTWRKRDFDDFVTSSYRWILAVCMLSVFQVPSPRPWEVFTTSESPVTWYIPAHSQDWESSRTGSSLWPQATGTEPPTWRTARPMVSPCSWRRATSSPCNLAEWFGTTSTTGQPSLVSCSFLRETLKHPPLNVNKAFP